MINLIFNIQYTNFLRPLFCLFLVKSAKIRPEIFFSVAPFELFGRNFCLATLQHWLCVVVLLRTENTCRPGRYGKESCCPPCYPWAESSRETERGGPCLPIATEVALLAVPARPALNRSGLLSLSHTQHSVLQRQADGTVYAGVIGSKWRSSVL